MNAAHGSGSRHHHGGPRGGRGDNPPHAPQGPAGYAPVSPGQKALATLRGALQDKGLSPDAAFQYARIILSRPQVSVTKSGQIHYQGRTYDPSAFATSSLANYVTGATAQARNQAALTGDPGYESQLAQLGLARDMATSGLADQRSQAILNYGDPNYTTDALLGGQAAANPFSTVRLMALADARAKQNVALTANRAGTLFGGGLQSGMQQEGFQNAGQVSDAARSLQSLLSGLSQQQASAQQAYGVGQQGALQDTYQRLLASGQIHAAQAPNLTPGRIRLFTPPGAPHVPGPPKPPHNPTIPPPPRPPHRHRGLGSPGVGP